MALPGVEEVNDVPRNDRILLEPDGHRHHQ
jgi:hypothetical protein